MSITAGSRVGPYEIVAPLGAGGMGEVYRARDTKLQRDVALKVLPDALACDSERVTRFRREAQVLASLNHPNVAGIYGLEESSVADERSVVRALIMELVDGPTLADRLAQGPLPLDEAIGVARQLAEAIEYAHDQGVIHRDLKPANIKISADGRVKVLDFGLAKAFGTNSEGPGFSPGQSPTFTTPAATQHGVILGTAAYMAPEQAKGKPVDRRADIWSYGIVLLEMLSGRPAFTGETASETIAHVITKDPDWSALPATTPSALRDVLRRCLVKDPRNRLQAIGEARIALSNVSPESTVSAEGISQVPARGSRRREMAWAAIALISAAAVVALLIRGRLQVAPTVEKVRFDLTTPGRGGPEYPQGSALISPDGRKLAYVALSESRPLLWVHSFETGSAQAIASTDGIGPSVLVWSPDSRALAFSVPSERRLKRVASTGGPATVICALPEVIISGSWGENDVILLGGTRVHRVSGAGGELTQMPVPANAQEESHRFPTVLPGARHYIYLATAKTGAPPVSYVASMADGTRRALASITSEVKYSPSGHLLFLREGALMAQRFDLARQELSGEPFLMIDRLSPSTAIAGAFSMSATGTLAFRPAGGQVETRLTWFDRRGTTVSVVGPPALYGDIELSPDDRYVAFESERGSAGLFARGTLGGDIWTFDMESGVTTRITSDPARDADPVWSPDGRFIAFRADRDGGHLYQRAVGVVGEDALVFKGKTRESPDHWSPDGKYLIFSSTTDVWALPLAGKREPIAVATSLFREENGRVSPDGRWIAYQSDESGRREIYIQSFPTPAVKRQVSALGGGTPRWSHDGRELYYLAPDASLMAVGVRASGDALSFGPPERLFQNPNIAGAEGQYAVSSTGRFLVTVGATGRVDPPITVILNWAASLPR